MSINAIRSRQSGNPTGPLGRLIGRLMVKDTAAANDRAVELLGLDVPATVLEMGFGQGRTAQRLISVGHRVVGVEVSPTMVAQAAARNRAACADGRATLVATDGVSIPFADRTADAALTVHTIYFMSDPQATMREAARVLRPGGRMVIASRVDEDPMPTWMDPDVFRIPTTQRIIDMLDVAGFDDIECHAGQGKLAVVRWFVATV